MNTLKASISHMIKNKTIFIRCFLLLVILAELGGYLSSSRFALVSSIGLMFSFVEAVLSALIPFWLYRLFFKAKPPHPFAKKLYVPFLKFLAAGLFMQLASFGMIEGTGLIQTIIGELIDMPRVAGVIGMMIKILIPLYIITRLYVFFPLLALDEPLQVKKMLPLTNGSYKDWMIAAIVIYFPLVILPDYLSGTLLKNTIVNGFSLFTVSFWVTYYNHKKIFSRLAKSE